jgi:hypothetical protein
MTNHESSGVIDLELLTDLFSDTDPLLFIQAGADSSIYDNAAKIISYQLFSDISRAQIQNIIWQAFFVEFCCGTIGGSNPLVYWNSDKTQARAIMGAPERWKNLAGLIRDFLNY